MAGSTLPYANFASLPPGPLTYAMAGPGSGVTGGAWAASSPPLYPAAAGAPGGAAVAPSPRATALLYGQSMPYPRPERTAPPGGNLEEAEEEEEDGDDDSDGDAVPAHLRNPEDAPKPPPGAVHPSIGSEAHATGQCKRCCFFPRGRCTNGYNCEFCHYEHEKRKRKNKKKKKKGDGGALAAAAATAAGFVPMPGATVMPQQQQQLGMMQPIPGNVMIDPRSGQTMVQPCGASLVAYQVQSLTPRSPPVPVTAAYATGPAAAGGAALAQAQAQVQMLPQQPQPWDASCAAHYAPAQPQAGVVTGMPYAAAPPPPMVMQQLPMPAAAPLQQQQLPPPLPAPSAVAPAPAALVQQQQQGFMPPPLGPPTFAEVFDQSPPPPCQSPRVSRQGGAPKMFTASMPPPPPLGSPQLPRSIQQTLVQSMAAQP